MNVALKVINAKDTPRPRGKFVVEFPDHTAIGISGAEVAEILESERNANAKVYKIHRTYPDGRMELAGIDPARFKLEDGFLFWRTDASAARADFESLRTAAATHAPPCRVRIHLAHTDDASRPYVVAMRYPAEYTEEMSAWLLQIRYQSGDTVEAGLHDAATRIIDRLQLWGTQDGTSTD